MIPPTWMLPATVMLDESERDDAPLVVVRRNLAIVFESMRTVDPAIARSIVSHRETFDRAAEACAAAESPEAVRMVSALLWTAFRLRARNLTPTDVTWECDGPGWRMRVPQAT